LVDEEKALSEDTVGDNEVSTNDNFALDYAWVLCMQSRTLILGYIVQVKIERERPHTCLRIL
jgi:hypothetical protein